MHPKKLENKNKNLEEYWNGDLKVLKLDYETPLPVRNIPKFEDSCDVMADRLPKRPQSPFRGSHF